MKLRKYFPKKLFQRFLLIIILPVFIVQLISTYIFYQTHIQKVIKRISNDTIQKIIFINKNFKNHNNFKDMNLDVSFQDNSTIKKKDIIKNTDKYIFFNQEKFFIETLLDAINEPISVKNKGDYYIIYIQKENGVLSIKVNKKELIVKTAEVFIMWNIILSFITLIIAIIFMKNQLKPIKLLKKHIKLFSLNKNVLYFKPTGAKEIRELGVSFIEMEKRLKKFIDQRTLMLAGISHDLRTPLTRMKLELEMMDTPSKTYLESDIEYMEKIINQYLNFTKNIKNEDKVLTNICDYINCIVRDYKKINNNISLKTKNIEGIELVLIQEIAFKRVMHNIVGNSFKFGNKVLITISKLKNNEKIIIDLEDNGKGVEDKYIEKLSEPFFKIDKSRNSDNLGVGLGLAIAKDILLSNNGRILFCKSKSLKGLKVQIILDNIYKDVQI